MPALVLGSGLTLLGVTRTLARKRIPFRAIGGEEVRRGAAGELDDLRGAAADLASYLQQLDVERAVLIPCSDELALASAELPAELGRRFLTYQPAADVLRQVVDKGNLLHLLADLEIPHPRTFLIDSPEDVAAIPWPSGSSLFVKPRNSQAFFRDFGVKGLLGSDPAELEALAGRAARHGHGLMAQEYVPGAPSNHYFIDGFAVDGQITSSLVRRRLRMYPPDFGNSTCMVTVPAEDAAQASASLQRLFSGLGYRGIFSAEFKRDERDGVFRLLEVNARPWWYVRFAARAGLDVVTMAYDAARGVEPSPSSGYQVGRRLTFPYYDYSACMHELGPLRGAWRFARDMIGTEHPVFEWADPWPAVKQWARFTSSFVARRFKRRD